MTALAIALGAIGCGLALLGAPAQLALLPVAAALLLALAADGSEVRERRRRTSEPRPYYQAREVRR